MSTFSSTLALPHRFMDRDTIPLLPKEYRFSRAGPQVPQFASVAFGLKDHGTKQTAPIAQPLLLCEIEGATTSTRIIFTIYIPIQAILFPAAGSYTRFVEQRTRFT
ncbi:hypothetical protein A4X06_0g1080 [Tilletia controversa]|uniref:Uncharacterized protein n=1 Tax=Tilletia controversa TaxID=13291 RepID=A0A8X7N0F2_9BASI|nr:hypothetical protein CF328_g677 [Tilletia controversa]KAE8254072.1 hypothetical protein A4X06_0g1080 [Tilletia controversa]